MSDNDPRVFFAAERTLLAWIRTALGLIGLGFVVAKFGLFLRILQPQVLHPSHPWTGIVGVALALSGATVSALAAWQHRRFIQTLDPHELPPRYRTTPGWGLGAGVAVAGLALGLIIAL